MKYLVSVRFTVVASKKNVQEATPDLTRDQALSAQAGYLDQAENNLIRLQFVSVSPAPAAAVVDAAAK